MSDEKIATDKMGGTKFIAVMFSMVLLAGIFWFTMKANLLNSSVIKYNLIALVCIVLTGVGGNLIEKLIPVLTIIAPLIPDIISKSWFGRKNDKLYVSSFAPAPDKKAEEIKQ